MTPFFFGPPTRRLYGVYHPPAGSHRAALQVLLCPPFGQEAVRTHRLMRLLAEQLGRHGIPAMRFDYFGTGESAGSDEEGCLTLWRDDIALAQQELDRRTRAVQSVWLGVRLGATLALMASATTPSPPQRMVLWEPILDGPAYLRELGTAHAQQTYDPFIQPTRPPESIRDEVIGFGVSPEWIREVASLNIEALASTPVEDCVHLAGNPSERANEWIKLQQTRGHAWRQQAMPCLDIPWHTEEADGASLAPPELLRLLIASIKGEAT